MAKCHCLPLRDGILLLLEQRFIRAVVSTSGLSMIAQGMGFVRQMLIASIYGVSRELDVFWVCFAMATLLVITPATVFESVCMPFLVREREGSGEPGLQRLAASLFKLSLCLGSGLALLLALGAPFLGAIFAAGFDAEEKQSVARLAWWFFPLVLTFLPYSALSAIHKSCWCFSRVFIAEAGMAITSVIVLYWGRDIPAILPLSYFSGYLIGALMLLPASRVRQGWGDGKIQASWQVLRQSGSVILANQIGTLSSLIDRFFQSLLLPGGISALSYVGQLIGGFSGLLSLREIFIVPLAEVEHRSLKLEKLISALLLLSIALLGAVELLAPEIIHLWLERGRFDAAAAEVSIQVLQVYAPVLVSGVIAAPLFRMFQIAQKVRFTYLGYFASVCFILVFGWIFVQWLKLDVRGMALTMVVNSWLTCGVAALLMPWCGIYMRWANILRYGLLAVLAAATGWGVGVGVNSYLTEAWWRLLLGGGVYCSVVALIYFLNARFLKELLR